MAQQSPRAAGQCRRRSLAFLGRHPTMPADIRPIPVPTGTEIHRHLPGAYFHDCYAQPAAEPLPPALAIYLNTVARSPAWVNAAMRLRNRIVSTFFGLKDLGRMDAVRANRPLADYRVGDRVGIFTLLYLSDDEVVLGDFDKHLRARVSVCRTRLDGSAAFAVSTVVHVNNLLGRAYLFFVVPVHRRIVPAVMARGLDGAR